MSIYTHPTKTSVGGQKLTVMTYRARNVRVWARSLRGPEPPRKHAEPPWVFMTAQVTIRKKSHNFFTLTSIFGDLGLSRKLVSRTIQPSREQAQRSTSPSVVLMCFSHVSTWVRLV
jgi:hypothetical protein